ncbi:MAG TPA: TolC family protein [Gemmatimonadaceae bacterium]|nr:TolC family protein [Gemmatimonadaceae bacterium]
MTDPTRQQLLDAAARVYSEHGFRGATTRRIAEEAGVNEVTLFRIFGSKAVLIEEAVGAIASRGSRPRLPDVPVDPVSELTEWAESEHGFMLANCNVMRTTMAEAHSRPDCASATAQHAECGLSELRGYIERLAKHHLIPSADIAQPASSMLMGTLWADASGRDMMPTMFPPAERAPAMYVKLLLRAIGVAAVALLLLALPFAAHAQQPIPAATAGPTTLSLAEALRIAEQKSEAVRIAAAGVTRARGQQRQAGSQRLPQIDATASYTRALQSQFQAISERFAEPDTGTGSGGGGIENSPLAQIFAAPNTALLQLNFSQNLFTAGRIGAAVAGADAARNAANIGLASSRAQAALDAAAAYFDAVASEQVLAIAESSLVLTERTLAQTQLGREVGTSAEFDLLRARVARDNQRPLVIQARGNRNSAYLRLKQLLDLPLAAPLELTTPIRDDSTVVADALGPLELADDRTVTPDTSVAARASVRQAEAQLDAQRSALTAAKLARLPSVRLMSTYQRFAYPPDGTFLPSALDLYFPNWTVSVGLSFPIFMGGRLSGDRMVAQANVIEAEERLRQMSEGAELDALLALNALEQAQASYLASVGTDAQAARAYEIAEVRFREGISTQIELTETRVQLEQARLQRVTAARDLEIAKLRLALLKDLPLVPPGMAQP